MLEKALKYLVSLGEAKVQNVTLPDGTVQTYSDKDLTLLKRNIPKATAIEMSNLTSLVAYIRSKADTMADKMIIQVASPTEVYLFSQLDANRNREYLVKVLAQNPSFSYEHFIDHKRFLIGVQSKFIDDDSTDKALILKFTGTVEAGTVANYGDDGVSQKATIKTGIATKNDALIPNPVKLRPFRTFAEVEQPVSSFIFRMKQNNYEGIECAIFEADGGAWKNIAMKNIKEYLEFELAELDQFVIIS